MPRKPPKRPQFRRLRKRRLVPLSLATLTHSTTSSVTTMAARLPLQPSPRLQPPPRRRLSQPLLRARLKSQLHRKAKPQPPLTTKKAMLPLKMAIVVVVAAVVVADVAMASGEVAEVATVVIVVVAAAIVAVEVTTEDLKRMRTAS